MVKKALILFVLSLSVSSAAKDCQKFKDAAIRLGREADLLAKEETLWKLKEILDKQNNLESLRTQPALDEKVIVELESDLKVKAAEIAKDRGIILKSKLSSSFTVPAKKPLTVDKHFQEKSLIFLEFVGHSSVHTRSEDVVENLRLALLSNLDARARPSDLGDDTHEIPMTVQLEKLEGDFNKFGAKCKGRELDRVVEDFSQYRDLFGSGRTETADTAPSVEP